MIVAGAGWISNKTFGALRRGLQEELKETNALYHQLEAEGFFGVPLKKVRWLNPVSLRFCLAAALALRDASDFSGSVKLDPANAGILSLSRDGALKANLDYFKDYVHSGRKLARGNLFIHTLPTSPLALVAMTLGLKGPLFHLSSPESPLSLLLIRSEALERRTQGLHLFSFMASEAAVVCFFLKPETAVMQEGLFLSADLKARAGHLGDPEQVLEALKVPAGVRP